MIDALDVASLEQFQLELIEAGFEPCDSEQRSWVGPLAESLRGLTDAETMKIVFADGWPFQHPRLFVDGLDEQHVTAAGDVCLWPSGAPGNAWMTLPGYLARVHDWGIHAKTEFRPEDFALDAHLYFSGVRTGAIATVNLESLRLRRGNGGRGEISATWEKHGSVLEIKGGRQGAIEGRWYFVGDIRVPPRTLDQVRALLDKGQETNFDRRYKRVAEHGEPRLFMLAWDRELGREALVLLAEKQDGVVQAEAIEVAPTDLSYLKLRAGPDVDVLAGRCAVVLGLGAIGSHLAVNLAEAGLGKVHLVDADHLRPTNVVRHAANGLMIGRPKIEAVKLLIRLSAPWTKVTEVNEAPWGPARLREITKNADLVVDATGSASFAALISHLCHEDQRPLVSAALYRGGALSRVRRQLPNDVPFADRNDASGHPLIPIGPEPIAYEPGCSSPVNNASPVAVASVAALAAEVASDYLAGRMEYPDEVIDVYRMLDEPPFDKLGKMLT